MLNRQVKIIESNENKKKSFKTFSDCLSSRNIILLGEPGSGKTHLFKSASKFENAKYYTAREFSIHAPQTTDTEIFYIDALDEMRSTQNLNTIDALLKIIIRSNPNKIRISCRVADWLGNTDLEIFRPYFDNHGGFEVIQLQELTNDEIEKILADKKEENPRIFINNAIDRGVESLLRTPQTLIMLQKIVQSNIWPSSKSELYKLATDLLISEQNEIHSRSINNISKKSIKDACGAICASILISDISAISLISSASSENNPHILEIPYKNTDIFSIALATKLFQSTDYDIFTYSHRTIAEFLAAEWLSHRVKQGFSIKRLLSLITIDGYPTSELRGLFAWLVFFMPEYSSMLITSDPYGILMYADSKNLGSRIRKELLTALQKLSRSDPWFRTYDWTSQPLGALSNQDMVETFSKILLTSDNFHLRSIILDAIENGPILQNIFPILKNILLNKNRHLSEKKSVSEAICRATPDGEKNLVDLYHKNLKDTHGNIQLKLFILRKIYSDNFKSNDILKIIQEYINSVDQRVVGDLYFLDEVANESELEDILDELCKLVLPEKEASYNNCLTEVSFFYSKLLIRFLNSHPNYNSEKVYSWLVTLNTFEKKYPGSNRQEINQLIAWLSEDIMFLKWAFEFSLKELKGKHVWMYWHHTTEVFLNQLTITDAIDILLDKINNSKILIQQRIKYFELAFWLIKDSGTSNLAYFESLISISELVTEFSIIVEQLGVCPIDSWRLEDNERRFKDKAEKSKTISKNKNAFEKDKNIISSGTALGWMGWLSFIYFGRFIDQNRDIDAWNRLVENLGEENSAIAINGFRMVLTRKDLPSPTKVAKLYIDSKYFQWWYSVIAGMIEEWNINPILSNQNENFLKSVVAIDFVCTITNKKGNVETEVNHPWMFEIKKQFPRYYKDVLWEFIWISTQHKKNHIQGIHELLNEVELDQIDLNKLIKYINKFPNMEVNSLNKVLVYLCSNLKSKNKLLSTSTKFLLQRNLLKTQKRATWLGILFLFDFSENKSKLTSYFLTRTRELWSFINFIDAISYPKDNKISNIELTSTQIAFLIPIMSKHFSNVPHPNGIRHGSTNEWDGSENIKRKISLLSTHITDKDQYLLENLLNVKTLDSYNDYILHSLAKQKDLIRQSQFSQPSWNQVIDSIFHNKPANIAELYAMTQDILNELKITLNSTNTDPYKYFWNEDQYSRITDPKNEESGRDNLIDLIRHKYESLGIRVEPEGHMAADKRADIVLLPPVPSRSFL